jgi:hypothetical protein
MGGKYWSKEDENRLVLAYQSGAPLAQIAAMFPGRTRSSVRTFASKVGAKHPEHQPWTPEEEAVLAEIWAQPRILKAGMSRLPGRTYDAARVHAKAMGLGEKPVAQKGSRSPFFNCIIGEIKKNGPLTSLELSRLLKVSRRTMQRVLQDCHGVEFHIGDWKNEASKHLSMMWAIGPGPDAPKPPPKSAFDAHKDYRIRKRIKGGRINPFASAAGLVAAPQGQPGRVFIHLWDDKEAA